MLRTLALCQSERSVRQLDNYVFSDAVFVHSLLPCESITVANVSQFFSADNVLRIFPALIRICNYLFSTMWFLLLVVYVNTL